MTSHDPAAGRLRPREAVRATGGPGGTANALLGGRVGTKAWGILCALVVAAAPVETSAAKPNATTRRKAKQHMKAAFRHFRSREYQRSIDEWKRAYGVVPDPEFIFNQALVYDMWKGHCGEAMAALRTYLDGCQAPGRRCKSVRDAKKRLDGLRDECFAEIAIETAPTAAALTLDGKFAGNAPLVAKLGPGGHKVVAELDGYDAKEQVFEAKVGEPLALRLVLERRAPAAWLSVHNRPPTAALSLDGTPLEGALPDNLQVTPGRHRLEVILSDQDRRFVEVTVQDRQTAVVDLSLARPLVSGAPAGPPARSVAAEVGPEAASEFTTVGWSALGVGLAALAGAGVLGGLALDKHNQAGELADDPAPDDLSTLRSRIQTLDDETNELLLGTQIALGVGVGALTAGIVLLIVGDGEAEASAVSVGPVVGPNTIGFAGRF